MQTSNQIQGLTPQTAKVFEQITQMDCIKNLWLCGGTGLSLQLGHRLSEDLDFELIGTKRTDEKLAFGRILNELRELFPEVRKEILGNDHFLAFVGNGVKLSFFRPENPVPELHEGFVHNYLKTPSLQDLLGMKVYTTSVRNTFRDYYDIYCLLEEGCDLDKGIKYACDFSRHTLHSKSLASGLLASGLYEKELNFDAKMFPKYILSSEQIANRIRQETEKIARLNKPKPQRKTEKQESSGIDMWDYYYGPNGIYR